MFRRTARTTPAQASEPRAALAAAALLAAVALFAPFATAHAQNRRGSYVSNTAPGYWVGLSYGYQNGVTIDDRDTGASWQLGYTSQVRATLEKTIQAGVSIGVSAGFSTAPLTYTGTVTPQFDSCLESCTGTADVTQYMVFVQGGTSTSGFHPVYSAEGGVTSFSNFRDKSTAEQLPPANGKYDFSFGLGGGLGYTLSPEADVYATETFDIVLHPQSDNAPSSAPRLSAFRAGFRIGF